MAYTLRSTTPATPPKKGTSRPTSRTHAQIPVHPHSTRRSLHKRGVGCRWGPWRGDKRGLACVLHGGKQRVEGDSRKRIVVECLVFLGRMNAFRWLAFLCSRFLLAFCIPPSSCAPPGIYPPCACMPAEPLQIGLVALRLSVGGFVFHFHGACLGNDETERVCLFKNSWDVVKILKAHPRKRGDEGL